MQIFPIPADLSKEEARKLAAADRKARRILKGGEFLRRRLELADAIERALNLPQCAA